MEDKKFKDKPSRVLSIISICLSSIAIILSIVTLLIAFRGPKRMPRMDENPRMEQQENQNTPNGRIAPSPNNNNNIGPGTGMMPNFRNNNRDFFDNGISNHQKKLRPGQSSASNDTKDAPTPTPDNQNTPDDIINKPTSYT